MFNQRALANSLAQLTGLIYVLFYVLLLVVPGFFNFFFNAQFLGANIAGLVPTPFAFGDFIWTLVAVVVFAWLMGYVWAWLYNNASK